MTTNSLKDIFWNLEKGCTKWSGYFDAAKKNIKDLFDTLAKQQMMEQLTADVHAGLIKFPEGIIADEMRNFEFEHTATGLRYSAPSGLHDDAVCALALARYCSQKNKKGIFVII